VSRSFLFPSLSSLSLPQSPQLVVRGTLAQTPLAEFLVQAYDGELEGSLILQTPEGEKSALLFVRGAPAKARLGGDDISLGVVAVDLGLVEQDIATVIQARAAAEEKTIGELFREEGLLDETALYVAFREQISRQVLMLCDLSSATGFGFYRENFLANWGDKGQWRVKPLPTMWRALAEHLPDERREAWLKRLGDTPLKMRAESPVSRYSLTKKETGIINMLRAMPMSVERLADSGVGGREQVEKVACALLLSRQIEVGLEKEPLGLNEPPETPQSIPPPEIRASRRSHPAPRQFEVPSSRAGVISRPRSDPRTSQPYQRITSARKSRPSGRATASRRPLLASVEKFREEIQEFEAAGEKTHYEVLGIDREAAPSTIVAAFFQLAKRWHPDRLPPELSEFKVSVNKAFAAMGEAHQTLSDETRRAQYDKLLLETPDDEQAQVAAILDSANRFARAEVLMKKRDFAGALEQAKIAYKGDSTQADYAALYGWLQGMHRKKDFDDLISLLDGALENNEENVRALWYRGQLLKKAGKMMRAVKDFKQIVVLKPNHVDAKRELRVYAMRKRSNPDATKPSGFLGRFKK